MIFNIIASITIIILVSQVLRLKKRVDDLEDYSFSGFDAHTAMLNEFQEYLSDHSEDIQTLDFRTNCYYFDFLNHLHKNFYLREGTDGRHYPERYPWTTEEELTLISLKRYIDEECDKRNIPKKPMNRVQGL